MASIQEYLDLIKNAIYGKDVRQAIHDGIQQCYYDGHAGAVDLSARQRLDTDEANITSLTSRMSTAEGDIDVLDARVDQIVAPSGEAPSAAEVSDARIGDDGVTYINLGGAIRTQISDLKSNLDERADGLYSVLRSYSFSQGVYTNDGTDTRASGIKCDTVLHSADTIRVYVTIASGYRLLARRFGSADISQGALSTQEFQTNTFYDLVPDYYYGFFIQKTDNSNIYTNEKDNAQVFSYRLLDYVPNPIKLPTVFMGSVDNINSVFKDLDHRTIIFPRGTYSLGALAISINSHEDFKIIGSGCTLSTLNAFVITNSQNFEIDGLSIYNATYSGIETANCSDFRITNCDIDIAEQGIRTTSTCYDFSIDHCRVSNTSKDGILVYQAAHDFVIADNMLTDIGAIGIECEGRSGDSADVVKIPISKFSIANNVVKESDDWGYLVIAGTGFSFSGNVGNQNVGAALFIGCTYASIAGNTLEGIKKGFEISHQYFPNATWKSKAINVVGNSVKATISRNYDGVFSVMNAEDITASNNNIIVDAPSSDYEDTVKALRIASVANSAFCGNTINGAIVVGVAIERGYDYTTSEYISDASTNLIVSNNAINGADYPIKVGQFSSDVADMSGYKYINATNNIDENGFVVDVTTTGISDSEILKDTISESVVQRIVVSIS